MEKVLIVGDSPSAVSGLSYLSLTITQSLVSVGITVGYANLTSHPYDTAKTRVVYAENPWIVKALEKAKHYSVPFHSQNHVDALYNAICEFSPDVIIAIHDPWLLGGLCALKQLLQSFVLVIYQTVEVPHYPATVVGTGFECEDNKIIARPTASIEKCWKSADLVIPLTEMGRRAIREYTDRVSEPIPPGVDVIPPVFLRKGKDQVFRSVKPGQTVFMSMGINRPRKALDRVVTAFAKAAKKVSDIVLYLHTQPLFNGGYDLAEIAREHGVADRVLFDTQYFQYLGISRRELMERYANADVYIGLPCGEGFGYGFVEALSYGKPVIYSEYGGHAEICDGHGIKVSCREYVHAQNSAIRWGLADIDEAAEAIVQMSNEDVRKRYEQDYRPLFRWETQLPLLHSAVHDAYLKAKPHLKKHVGMRTAKVQARRIV